uniref:guanylate cyclase n=1 Tax=Caenorhabditis tropicalis TaxID=1561998 RepID=A0A1I7TCM2_9PELO
MYGLIIDHIATYIKEKYGESTWAEVKFVSGVTEDTFQMDKKFSEGLSHKLIWGCHDVTGDPVDELMNNIGTSFYKFLTKYEFNKVLRVLGRTFPQFLNGLDNLHEYLRFTFPKLKPPSFYCEHESRTGLTLHYRSKRRGFLHYVQGQIRNIAEELFQTEVVIELLDIEHDMNLEHIIMRLHFNNLDFNRQGTAYRNLNDSILEKVKITSDIFFDIFPFIIVFNRGMRIRNIGIGLLRVMAGIVGKKINKTFLLMRPFIRFRWEEVHVYLDGYLCLTEERHRMGDVEREKFLSLKGQMFYMEEWESICYVGIPVMSHLPQMYKSGLFINDFALHDSSRDLVLASTQQAAELKLLLHQEAQKSRNMRENMNRLKKERRRTDKLLYQMLPKSVANLLRNGESAVACCERFDSVTILFTDIVEFTKMCSSLTPLEVIEFLQVIYTNFDKIIDVHGVYKVETIGDAYMVVSGAPTKTEHDAEFILDCASQFLVEAGKMVNMSAKIPKIDIRAGVHSGSVVAGVVGLSMPRYCLFGETVFVANKMEQNSVPMKVLVSETTHNKIEESDPGLYQFEMREEIEIRDEQTIQTFFVVSRHGPPRVPSPRNCESRQDDSRNEEDDDDDLIFPGVSRRLITQLGHDLQKAGRKSPTSEAEDELKKKGQLSFTPVSDTGIERHSRNSNRTHSQDITPRNSLT